MQEVTFNYIKIWCEYDISGDFGGNNNETCMIVSNEIATEDVDLKVAEYLSECTGFSIDELEGLFGWEYILVEELV